MNIMMNSITDEGWRGYQPLPDTGYILTIIMPDLGDLPRHSLRKPIRWNSTGSPATFPRGDGDLHPKYLAESDFIYEQVSGKNYKKILKIARSRWGAELS
jgi:hypothetical protein